MFEMFLERRLGCLSRCVMNYLLSTTNNIFYVSNLTGRDLWIYRWSDTHVLFFNSNDCV